MLERLYLLKWGPMDGLGAVVISPTRELAVQTFNMLRDIGKYHSFSAGLVIGGKPLKEERDRLGRMNILIATPGRLLQHLDSTVGFESAGVKVLGGPSTLMMELELMGSTRRSGSITRSRFRTRSQSHRRTFLDNHHPRISTGSANPFVFGNTIQGPSGTGQIVITRSAIYQLQQGRRRGSGTSQPGTVLRCCQSRQEA
jgi:hypothetical protein